MVCEEHKKIMIAKEYDEYDDVLVGKRSLVGWIIFVVCPLNH